MQAKKKQCCDAGCTTRAQMRERHGHPDKFAIACYAAVPGFISVDEAEAGIARYRARYEAAPENAPPKTSARERARQNRELRGDRPHRSERAGGRGGR